MQIGINDLDDDDFGTGFESSQQVIETPEQNNSTQEPPTANEEDDDFVSDFLKTRGIDDISKIKFEDDEGNIEEKSWDSLTNEEKINILNTPLDTRQDNSNNLTDEEIQLLNQIRQSNLTPSKYIEQIQGQQVIQEPQYKIDDLSDDELFLLDLESTK